MITKQGYVFIARMNNGVMPLFGRAVRKEDKRGGYDNIFLNEITLFDDEQTMRAVMQRYDGVGPPELVELIPASLAMKIAQSAEEAEEFRELTDLVAVRILRESYGTDTVIYGPINKKFMNLYHGVLPCQKIYFNKLLTFRRRDFGERTFKAAMEARYQVQRQSDNAPTMLATFKLKKLGGIISFR
jgi:hypothetical protein